MNDFENLSELEEELSRYRTELVHVKATIAADRSNWDDALLVRSALKAANSLVECRRRLDLARLRNLRRLAARGDNDSRLRKEIEALQDKLAPPASTREGHLDRYLLQSREVIEERLHALENVQPGYVQEMRAYLINLQKRAPTYVWQRQQQILEVLDEVLTPD